MIRLLLPLAVLLSAAASLTVELAIVRLGAPYLGQSLLPWSAAIVSVLLGLTIGHMLGGLTGGETATSHALRGWLSAVCFA
ncbi:MAG: fused MFS/spermidine synthase, partial [Xanthobacteraceae bacterium]